MSRHQWPTIHQRQSNLKHINAMTTTLKLVTQTALLILPFNLIVAQQPTPQERVVALKASLAASQAILKQYEWVETTVVSLKGEEKSRQMNRCYYGADGKVQKIPLTTPPPAEKKRGLRGRIAEAKKEELTDFMKDAVALVKQYTPPEPVLIQRAKDAGKVTVQPLPGQKARLTFSDYLKPGDSFALILDLGNNRPVEAKVSSYLDSQEDAVALDVKFKTLDNNATYAAQTMLNAPTKHLSVTVVNSGYRRQ
jgi:hypothetical protein